MADFYSLVELGVSGAGLCTGLFLVRLQRQRRADVRRQTYELKFMSSAGHVQFLDFVRSLSTFPRPRGFQNIYALSFEHYADANGERWFAHVRGDDRLMLDQLFLDHVDGVLELVDPPDDPVLIQSWTQAVELGMSPGALRKPLQILNPLGTSVTFGTPFKNLGPGEAMVQQIAIYPDIDRPVTPENKDKHKDKLFHATVRLAVMGDNPRKMLQTLMAPFHSLTAHGVYFYKRHLRDVTGRVRRRASTYGYLVYFNAYELSCILWPLNGEGKKAARRLKPTLEHDEPGPGFITLGTSNSPRMDKRHVAIPIEALLTHGWVSGPTKSGKSTLLENIGSSVMWAMAGLSVIEAKGDLCDAMVNDVPPHRRDEVTWFDPRDTAWPIGLNILRGDNPSRITGHVISMFKTLSGDAWGHQLQRVLRNAVYTACLINEAAKDISEVQTLYDVKQLLVNREYRTQQVRKLSRSRHPDVLQEWHWLDEKADIVVDAAVTRLDAFLGDPLIRNIVGQRGGLDVDHIVRDSKILFAPFPSALLGDENAAALSMLLWEMLWDAHMRRPRGERRPNILIADEYQTYAGNSLSKADPFALARSYGLGLVVANQFASQLPRAIRETVSKNAQNIITFAAAPDEARDMKDHFGPLTAEDLQYLPQYTIAARLMGTAGRTPTVTLKTPPPPQPTGTASYIIDRSRSLYGVPRATVEADLASRHQRPKPPNRPKIGDFDE